jgi:hypothetical protein
MKTKGPSTLAALLLLLSASATQGSDVRYGTHHQPLTGPRYQTMLVLAGFLHSTAQGALDGAVDEARHGTVSESRFLASVRTFARSAGEFHRALDGYAGQPFDVPARVAVLADSARRLHARILSAGALKSTHDDWTALIDVLDKMTALLAGQQVDVPTAYAAPALSGPTLEQLRQLAAELEQSAAGAHEGARRQLGAYRDRGPQFLGELEYFAARSKDLRAQAESQDVHPQAMSRTVDRLLEEARRADRAMRAAAVFTSVWSDSGRTITILEQMAGLVRS